jgi:hypothetical protein
MVLEYALTAPEPGEQVPSQDDHPWNPNAQPGRPPVLVGVLRRLDCRVSVGCPSRGGLAALVDVALGPRAHDTDAEDPRGATSVHLDVATPQVVRTYTCTYTCTYQYWYTYTMPDGMENVNPASS